MVCSDTGIPITIAALMERDKVCQICGCITRKGTVEDNWGGNIATRGHIIARANGGEDTYSNVHLECWECNIAKGASDTVTTDAGEATSSTQLLLLR